MTRRHPMEILRKMAACAFAFALAATLMPATALATPADLQPLEETGDTTVAPIAEGTIGNCTWSINGQTGELSIEAPESGAGSLGNVYTVPWADHAADIKFVFFGPGISSAETLHGLFANCTSLVFVNFSNFDTSKATDMSSMFEGCTSLPAVNIASLNTANVTNMDSMFKNCTALRQLTLAGVATSSAEYMQSMFEGCSALRELDLTGITTTKAANMQSMFAGCSSLGALDISGFTFANVANMKDMFSGCEALATLTLPAFTAPNATDMSGVFAGCSSLTQLDFTNANTAGTTTMARMFQDCAALTSLDLSSFNTTNVTDMEGVFSGCTALATLDISGFDTAKATSMETFFGNCEALTKVTLGADFSFKGEASWLPAGSWASSIGDDTTKPLTAREVAEQHGGADGAEVTYTREMMLTNAKLSATTFVYNGEKNVPSVVVTSGDRTLVEGTDYIVTAPDDAVSAGEKTLYIAGAGAYSGGWSPTYTITPATVTELILDAETLTYDGTEKVPGLTVKAGDLTLDSATDFDVTTSDDTINVGNKSISITAKGNFTGELEASYEVVPAAITALEFDVDKFTYNGAEQAPAVTVKAGNLTLDPDDYKVTLPADRTNIGDKTIKVVAQGNFTGELEANYAINPAAISTITLSATEYTYDGKEKTPAITVKCGDKVLTAGTDYAVTLPTDRTKVGTKTVKVAGKGNYTGTLEASYKIVEAPKPDTPDTPKPDNPDTPKPDTPDTPTPGTPTQSESQAMLRLYNPNSGEHFFTASTFERDHLVGLGWNDEGVGWIAPKTGDAVYRLYNPNAGEHHYTLSVEERDMLVSAGWNDEGVGWYSDPNKSVALHRVYNPNEFANNHHYTTSVYERGYLVGAGWLNEGVGWYGIG